MANNDEKNLLEAEIDRQLGNVKTQIVTPNLYESASSTTYLPTNSHDGKIDDASETVKYNVKANLK